MLLYKGAEDQRAMRRSTASALMAGLMVSSLSTARAAAAVPAAALSASVLHLLHHVTDAASICREIGKAHGNAVDHAFLRRQAQKVGQCLGTGSGNDGRLLFRRAAVPHAHAHLVIAALLRVGIADVVKKIGAQRRFLLHFLAGLLGHGRSIVPAVKTHDALLAVLAKEQQQRIDKILVAVGAQGVRALVFPVDLAVRRRNAVAAFEHDVAAAARKHQAEC